MIFISGVHGVGKSFFCNLVKETLGIAFFSASDLIKDRKMRDFPTDKHITNIEENQQYLLTAVNDLRDELGEFLLDGHFCLLNSDGRITRISLNTFTNLKPDAIILLSESPEIIAKRLQERDSVKHTVDDIKIFQDEENKYANEVSELLKIPIITSMGSNDIDNAIEFIRVWGDIKDGGKV